MGLVEREAEMQDLQTPRPGRSRDLFGVQLEVTSLLLEGERRKLAVLQRELQVALAEGGSVKAKEKQRQELLHAISKIQGQHEQLDKEYRIHAAGVLLCNSRGCGKLNVGDASASQRDPPYAPLAPSSAWRASSMILTLV
ncbi:uncharacterized protein LOC112493965 [Cephus cinctus]|uniref:Uncharacterized protein LOC112493965 n=1 Tax=Cephus cinctus TaxID=211228 RepID=A0AAJ7VYU4_CEPCN|nr:uncharacterized protein LOC112493965 [Cephus cinctus]